MAPFIISIEGNIGSGKSTFVDYLRRNMENVILLQEPVNQWTEIKDSDGESILSKFYKDQHSYSFPFQMMAYISRLALLKKTVEENPDSIIITERCLLTDREVFARMLYNEGKIEDVNYQIYLMWFNTFYDDFPISRFIYLRTSPETAFERVQKRNRDGESIPLEYLTACHHHHEQWLYSKTYNKDVITIDANNDESHMSVWIQQVKQIYSRAK